MFLDRGPRLRRWRPVKFAAMLVRPLAIPMQGMVARAGGFPMAFMNTPAGLIQPENGSPAVHHTDNSYAITVWIIAVIKGAARIFGEVHRGVHVNPVIHIVWPPYMAVDQDRARLIYCHTSAKGGCGQHCQNQSAAIHDELQSRKCEDVRNRRHYALFAGVGIDTNCMPTDTNCLPSGDGLLALAPLEKGSANTRRHGPQDGNALMPSQSPIMTLQSNRRLRLSLRVCVEILTSALLRRGGVPGELRRSRCCSGEASGKIGLRTTISSAELLQSRLELAAAALVGTVLAGGLDAALGLVEAGEVSAAFFHLGDEQIGEVEQQPRIVGHQAACFP